MEGKILEKILCRGVEDEGEGNDDYKKVEKVLAPFLRSLKKRKRIKADIVPEEFKEFYLKRSPKDLLIRLQDSFADPLGTRTLLNESAELLKVVTNSKAVNLYLPDYSRGEILLCPKYVQENDRFEKRYIIESGTFVATHVALTKEYVISNDILGDVRFPLGVPHAGPTVKAVMCFPVITNVREDCVAVVELYRDCLSGPYDLVNLQICTALMAWIGIAIEQNNGRLLILKELEIQKQLSLLADLYFSGFVSFDKIISDIMKITKGGVNAEKGGFYVFHQPVPLNCEDILLADSYEEGFDEAGGTALFKKENQIRFAKNEPGIPGYVARSGQVVNVHDAYKDHRFDRKTDSPFFRTRSVVAFPIKNNHGVLAVLKLINSLNYPYFQKEDIDLVQSYVNCAALICGYFLLEKTLNKTQLNLMEANRLVDYHTKPTTEEVTSLKTFVQGEQQLPNGFFKFDWDSTNYEEDAHKYIAYTFLSSDILEPCFEFQNLADFLLRVKKAYRPLLYHSFEHAFSVFHCTYNIIAKNEIMFTAVEVVTLLLTALCHDIDHAGLTNSFLSLKNDISYRLYGDFCGEAHRFQVCMYLIRSTDLLSNVSAQTYQTICKNLKRLFLGFDLAVHFQNRRKILELLNTNTFSWEDSEHRYLAHTTILTCADYCMNYKSFSVVKKSTSNFYKEMYQQGDLEKSMGFSPLPMMDRNKADLIPENQIILLTIVCCPCVEVVVTLFSNLKELSDLLNQTLIKWKEIVAMKGQEVWKLNQALVKEKKDKRSHRVTLSSTLSSIRTVLSDARSDK